MADVDRMRAEFFRKTRTPVGVFYAGLALAGVACLAVGVARHAVWAVAAFVAAVALAALLFVLSARIPVSARVAQQLVWVGPLVGVVAATLVDVHVGDRGIAVVLGACGGCFGGVLFAVARIRRRLATDDELLLRQVRLGFDPEHPMRWMRVRRR